MKMEAFLARLGGVRSCGTGRWSACCPAHNDKSPSLSVREAGSRLLLHCFSGCTPDEIVLALGLELKGLFTDTPTSRGQWPTAKPQKIDLVAVAHRFELAALDRRLRADAVLQAVGNFTGEELADPQRDRLINAVAQALEDRARAEFLEIMADDFRWKAFEEGRKAHAA